MEKKTKRQIADEKREAKKQERINKAERLRKARADAIEACQIVPKEIATWGAVRSRAYLQMVEVLDYRASLKAVTAEELEAYTRHLRDVATMQLEDCQQLASANIRRRLTSIAT